MATAEVVITHGQECRVEELLAYSVSPFHVSPGRQEPLHYGRVSALAGAVQRAYALLHK